MPTGGAPTLLVAGFPMHRIKGIDPHEDTLIKFQTIAPLVGRVLDTATGLGYTAIEVVKTAEGGRFSPHPTAPGGLWDRDSEVETGTDDGLQFHLLYEEKGDKTPSPL